MPKGRQATTTLRKGGLCHPLTQASVAMTSRGEERSSARYRSFHVLPRRRKNRPPLSLPVAPWCNSPAPVLHSPEASSQAETHSRVEMQGPTRKRHKEGKRNGHPSAHHSLGQDTSSPLKRLLSPLFLFAHRTHVKQMSWRYWVIAVIKQASHLNPYGVSLRPGQDSLVDRRQANWQGAPSQQRTLAISRKHRAATAQESEQLREEGEQVCTGVSNTPF